MYVSFDTTNKDNIRYIDFIYKNSAGDCNTIRFTILNNVNTLISALKLYSKNKDIRNLIGNNCIKCSFRTHVMDDKITYCPKCGKNLTDSFNENYCLFFK